MAPYEVGVAAQFEAAHALIGDFGPATRLHGHTYRVEVSVRGAQLHPDGTLFNILLLQDALAVVIADLHYRELSHVPWLAGINTTVEALAERIWQQLAPALVGQGLTELAVHLYENPGAWAVYTAALAEDGR